MRYQRRRLVDAPTALEGVEKLAERFDVAGAKRKAETLVTAARHASTSTQHKVVAEAARGVIDQLGVTDDYETALSGALLVYAIAWLRRSLCWCRRAACVRLTASPRWRER